jgi:Fe-S-cluster containining protein
MNEQEFIGNIEWVKRHGVSVYGIIPDKRAFMLKIDSPCKCLTDDNKCSLYDSRPEICQKYKCRALECYLEEGYFTKGMIHKMTNKTKEEGYKLYEEYKAKGLIPQQ